MSGRMSLRFSASGFSSFTKIFCGFFVGMTLCAAPGSSHAAEPSKVLAKVNGVPITESEVEYETGKIASRNLYHNQNVPSEKRAAFEKEALENLINQELEYQEAKRQGITADKEEINERVGEVKKRFASEGEFKATLKKNNLTLAKYEESIRKALLIEKIVSAEVEKKAEVSDDEEKAYYENNKERFKEPEMIKVRHIAIGFDPSKGTEDMARAKGKAEEILKMANSGEDFATLAREYSDDSYRDKGGDLGYVPRGRMDPELEKVAFSLKPGEIIGPVETRRAYYIIKMVEKKPERTSSFDEVKEGLRKVLEARKMEERSIEWIASLRKKAKIEYRE